MSAITSFNGPTQSGPDQYAPPDRRSPKKLGEVDQAARALEEAIRRLPRQQDDPANDPAVELIQRVAGLSMEEIDRVILELQDLRDTLRKEGERVSHEIARYTRLNQASMTAMKSIADSLIQRKSASEAAEHLTT
jgi:predicted RNase H-like nuclease